MNMARKGLPKLCWGSDKHTAVNRNGGDSDIEQIENNFKDPEDGFGIKTTQKVS